MNSEPDPVDSPVNQLADFDIFLSFSSSDRLKQWFGASMDIVVELKTALERHRHPDTDRRLRVCSYDEDFELGGDIRESIVETIRGCRALLFLSTKGARDSAYVRFELETGRDVLPAEGVLSAAPAVAFPEHFRAGAHAADLSKAGCTDRKQWRRRVEIESAKVAARVWQLPLERVRDRFLLDQRRRRRRLTFVATGVAIVLAVAAGIGANQYQQRQVARELAIYQRYAAGMSTVQRAWSAGNVTLARDVLVGFQENIETPDPRSFEWDTYALVTTAERRSLGTFADMVTGLAVAAHAPWLAFATEDKPATIHDVEAGRELATLSKGTIGAAAMAFEPGTNALVVATPSALVRWTIGSQHESPISAPRGVKITELTVCGGARPRTLALDEVGSLYLVRTDALERASARAFRLSRSFRIRCSASGRWLVGLGDDGLVQILDGATFGRRRMVRVSPSMSVAHFGIFGETAAVPDGDRIAIIDLPTGKIERTGRLVNGSTVSGVGGPESGSFMAVADPSDTSIVIREPFGRGRASQWHEVGSLKGYRGWATDIRILGDSWLVASTLGGDVKVWDLRRIGRRVFKEHSRDITDIAILPGTNDVVTLDDEGFVRRWELGTLKTKWSVRVADEGTELALRGSHLVVASRGLVHLLRPEDGVEEQRFEGWAPLDSIGAGALFAYQGLGDGEVILEDVKTGGRTTFVAPALPGMEAPDITALAIIDNPQAVIVTTADGRLMRFDRGRAEPTYAFKAHDAVIRTVTMSRDNTLVATGAADRSIRIWRADTGQPHTTLSGHTDSVQALAFSHDGRTLASGGKDGTVKLWNLNARLETVTFFAHQADLHPGVASIAFTPRDAHLISAGALGTVVRWDTETTRQVDGLGPRIKN